MLDTGHFSAISRFFAHPVQTGQYMIQLVDVMHEAGCSCMIRMNEELVRLQRGVTCDLDLIVDGPCKLLRSPIFARFISHTWAGTY
jgi:hypothetical protein